MANVADVLIIGAGPAGLSLAAALAAHGVTVAMLAPQPPTARWANTYGIWADELEPLGLLGTTAQRWTDCVVDLGDGVRPLGRTYALFDNDALRDHLLGRCGQGDVTFHTGMAATIGHTDTHSHVTTQDGHTVSARLVVDASGHRPAFVQRPAAGAIAYQAAYGIVGTFSRPPVAAGRMVLMDYRADHLTADERLHQPPTFLYAMDLGDGRYFVEETSLAHAPAVPMETLQARLHRRLAHLDLRVEECLEEERCLFPMNLPVPGFGQPVLGYGAAASMVHPATGYQVGAALHRAGEVATALRNALENPHAAPAALARVGWSAVWPAARLRNHYLYLFGLQNVVRFDVAQTQAFFRTFFELPHAQWTDYLSNRLSTPELMDAMLALFGRAPMNVRTALASSIFRDGELLWRAWRR
jgi:lycopene beta-cyclase